MKIIVKSVYDEYGFSGLNYLLKRLSGFSLQGFPSTQEFRRSLAFFKDNDIPLAKAEDFPALAPEKSAEIEKAKACAKRMLEKDYPLLEGETLENEFFSYLTEAFQQEPAGTGVLRQKTNFADVCFFFDNVRIEGDTIRFTAFTPVGRSSSLTSPMAGGVVASLALSLASGLLTGIGKEIGALICNEIFQAMDIDYFEPTSDMIKKIVHEEITTTTINQINGQINGTKDWISARYTPEKAGYEKDHNPDTLKYMQDELNSYADNMFTQVIGPLMQEQFAKPGFAVYLIGAGVHFSLYQELALIDTRVDSPSKSTYAETVAAIAAEYSKFGSDTYNSIIADRKAMIYMKQEKTCSYAGGYPVCNDYWCLYDTYTGLRQEFAPDSNQSMDDAKKACSDAMATQTQTALNQLNSDLGDPNSILPIWQKLEKQPVPSQTK